MLETEMQALRAEIADLKQAVNSLTATMIGMAHAMLPTTPVIPEVVTVPTVKVDDTTPEPTPETPPTPEPTPAAPLTIDDVQALCSAMVRDNPNIKPRIKELIQSFDGAKTLSKVPADRLPELKAALEALQ